ncbi:MAG: winged helix-turn-helix domain-containing protein [Alphaproteobacteria bacterium]|nr:winged helix-turn-helix domain-containing protein [Alphaproteobacteria bacterium]
MHKVLVYTKQLEVFEQIKQFVKNDIEFVICNHFVDTRANLQGCEFSAVIFDDPKDSKLPKIKDLKLVLPVIYLWSKPILSEGVVFQKPFNLFDFVSSLKKIVENYEKRKSETLKIGLWSLDKFSKKLSYEDKEIQLNDKECQLLICLTNSNDCVEKDEILHEVWGYVDGISTHTLETHIYMLRQKLEYTGLEIVLDSKGRYGLK